jgi:hypothetical protein
MTDLLFVKIELSWISKIKLSNILFKLKKVGVGTVRFPHWEAPPFQLFASEVSG